MDSGLGPIGDCFGGKLTGKVLPPKSASTVVGVTGGSGFLGINLIRFLLGKGFTVASLDVEPFSYPERSRVKVFQGDVRDPAVVKRFMSEVDAVVHAAAALPLHNTAEIFAIDVDGTRNVLIEARNAGISRLVHISSAAVYGLPSGLPCVEDSNLGGKGPYAEAKIQSERVAESFRSDLTVAILRPTSFIGPERLGIFSLLFDWAAAGCNFPILGDGKNRYQHLDVDDLCQMIWLTLIAESHIVNNTYNVGATSFGTFRDDIQGVLDFAGHGKKVISLPAEPFVAFLHLLHRLKLSPVYPWVIEGAVRDFFVSTERAQKELGFKPRFSNSDALKRNFEWFLENREQIKVGSGKSHRVAWKQGLLAVAKFFLKW